MQIGAGPVLGPLLACWVTQHKIRFLSGPWLLNWMCPGAQRCCDRTCDILCGYHRVWWTSVSATRTDLLLIVPHQGSEEERVVW